MADYKYEAETLRIMELANAIKAISESIDEFVDEIETEDVLKLQRQMKNATKTADRIVEHLSSLNTKEDRKTYIKRREQMERAEKVAVLLQHSNVLEYHSMNAAGITNEDIVAFQEYYNVRLREQGYGTWRWLSVHDIEGNHLSVGDLVKVGIRDSEEEESKRYIKNQNNISRSTTDKVAQVSCTTYPSSSPAPLNMENPYSSYGWVRPDGSFIPSDYGTHEESAIQIVKEMGWIKERRDSVHLLCRDFLVYVKGYALIHNPTMDGGYIVTRNPNRNLTKAQRTTLYDYFTYNGDNFLANQYINDEDEMER